MITQEIIQEVKKRLIKAYDPLTIYLYGSHAWGDPDEDSDLDLLVIIESSDEKVYKRSDKAFDVLLGLKIPKNVIVFTQQEFDAQLHDQTSLGYEIKKRGKVLYARS
jgi:predicted nucleotidyltransferase